MKSYLIYSVVGADLGVYRGNSELEAYNGMLQEASCKIVDEIPSDMRVKLVEEEALVKESKV